MSHFEWKGGNLHLRLKVTPKSSKDAIAGVLGDRLKVRITSPPVEGKANEHLIWWFAKLCGVPKSNVEVIRGETSRNKSIAITSPRALPLEFQLDDSGSVQR